MITRDDSSILSPGRNRLDYSGFSIRSVAFAQKVSHAFGRPFRTLRHPDQPEG
jgi:hypothetical protein